jgi:hypothetical protein
MRDPKAEPQKQSKAEQGKEGKPVSRVHKAQRPSPDSIKETPRMPKRLAMVAASISAALLLILPAASASAASPWWQIVDGARPTHLWEPVDELEVQEVKTEMADLSYIGPYKVFAAKVEVGGSIVGCLSGGDLLGFPGSFFCELETGLPGAETAAEFEAMLEGPYGAGEVEVTGGPVGGAPFQVATQWDRPVKVTPIVFAGEIALGTASSQILSEGSGRLFLILTNLGNAPLDATSTPLTIVDELPEGVLAYDVEGVAGARGEAGTVDCALPSTSLVSCTFEDELPSYEAIEVEIPVILEGSPPQAGAPGKVTVSGGNAATKSLTQAIEVSEEPVPFGFERFEMRSEEEGGEATTQAGAHPFQVVNTVQVKSGRMSGGRGGAFPIVEQPALPRNVRVAFPAGLVGTATPAPPCEMAVFLAVENFTNECPKESAVGVASVSFIDRTAFGFVRVAVPIFNLPPQHGEPARLGFLVVGNPVLISASADPEDGQRITGEVRNVTQLVQFVSATISLWGTPGDPRHDSSRGWECVYAFPAEGSECTPPVNRDETPFLRMPTQCKSPLDYRAEIEPWNVAAGSVVDEATFPGEPLLGCNRVPFDPKISSTATSKLAENPSGLDFELRLPGSGFDNPAEGSVSEAQPKRVEVVLPEGMTLNPAQAEGLAVCTPAQFAQEKSNSKPGEGCPEASKIGNVEAGTPLIDRKLEGSLYVAAPYDNPFNSLIATYITVRSPERGVLVKQPLEVRPDPETGQLVAIADNAPPAPYDYFRFHFREGGRAPLITPPACGNYETTARFVPWSAQDPDNPKPSEIVERKASFTVQRGVDGGACPPGGVPPFNPSFEAGSLNNDAKSYSPFYMRLTRRDGEQNMTKFSSVLPPGVLGKLAGVGKCSDSAIEAAKSKAGKEELASPSCPASSQIGRISAGAGVGSVLTYVGGKVYLAGPYKGAPLSVVVITPAVAGPFDVGTVVVREGLTLNPETAEVEVDGASSDPIPHILAGIPLKVRDLRVYVDRDQFIINPTSCDPSKAKATLFGSYLDLFSAADDVPAQMESRFQAANCANLGFRPKLKLNLKGGTKRGDFPGLRATLKARGADANIAAAQVTLPRSAFLEQGHIGTICTRVQFRAENCPKASVYGHAKAITPLLDEPIEGPVYMRSSDNKLPDLVIALKGIVDVNVVSRIDSFKGGLRSTFDSVPDAPISSFVLRMKGGKKGLIVNSRNLCAGKNRAKVTFTGQNGKVANLRPEMKPRCGKARKGKR